MPHKLERRSISNSISESLPSAPRHARTSAPPSCGAQNACKSKQNQCKMLERRSISNSTSESLLPKLGRTWHARSVRADWEFAFEMGRRCPSCVAWHARDARTWHARSVRADWEFAYEIDFPARACISCVPCPAQLRRRRPSEAKHSQSARTLLACHVLLLRATQTSAPPSCGAQNAGKSKQNQCKMHA